MSIFRFKTFGWNRYRTVSNNPAGFHALVFQADTLFEVSSSLLYANFSNPLLVLLVLIDYILGVLKYFFQFTVCLMSIEYSHESQ